VEGFGSELGFPRAHDRSTARHPQSNCRQLSAHLFRRGSDCCFRRAHPRGRGRLSAAPDRIPRNSTLKLRPNSDPSTEKHITQGAKSSSRIEPVRTEDQPARTFVHREHRAKPDVTREEINAARNLNSTTPAQSKRQAPARTDIANRSLAPSKRSDRPASGSTFHLPAREALHSSTDKTITTSALVGAKCVPLG